MVDSTMLYYNKKESEKNDKEKKRMKRFKCGQCEPPSHQKKESRLP